MSSLYCTEALSSADKEYEDPVDELPTYVEATRSAISDSSIFTHESPVEYSAYKELLKSLLLPTPIRVY